MPQIKYWQKCSLSKIDQILYIYVIHYSVRENGVIHKLASYAILDINQNARKEVLTMEVGENEFPNISFLYKMTYKTEE